MQGGESVSLQGSVVCLLSLSRSQKVYLKRQQENITSELCFFFRKKLGCHVHLDKYKHSELPFFFFFSKALGVQVVSIILTSDICLEGIL